MSALKALITTIYAPNHVKVLFLYQKKLWKVKYCTKTIISAIYAPNNNCESLKSAPNLREVQFLHRKTTQSTVPHQKTLKMRHCTRTLYQMRLCTRNCVKCSPCTNKLRKCNSCTGTIKSAALHQNTVESSIPASPHIYCRTKLDARWAMTGAKRQPIGIFRSRTMPRPGTRSAKYR